MAIKFTQTLDLTGQRITGLASPGAGTDAVNRDYVDNVMQGLDWRPSVRAATTTDIPDLAAPGVIDGVTLADGDRVLVKNQADPADNGVYVFDGTTLSRAADAMSPGAATSVEEGTANGGKTFLMLADDTWTLMAGGTAGSSYAAGDGLALDTNTFRVVAGAGLLVSGTGVRLDPTAVTRKYATNVGDGSANQITVNHALGTRDVVVEVFSNGGDYDTVFCETRRPDVNNVVLVFGAAPAANAYRVVVQG